MCSRTPSTSERRRVPGRPPVRPSVFRLLTGPNESHRAWGGGSVVGEGRVGTGGRRAGPSERLFDVGLPHLPTLTPFHSPSTVIVLHIDLLENVE